MPLDFPASPSVNDTYTFSGRTWKWNGSGWQLTSDGVVGTTNIANDAVTSAKIADGTIVDGDISGSAEIAVSKLADGTARQLLQTDAAGTGVEWTSNVDIPGTLDVTGATTLDSTLSFPLGSAGSPSLYPSSDTNTGIWSPAADTIAVSTGGVERFRSSTSEVVFNEGGVDCDFRIEGDTNANLFVVDAGTDEVRVANINGGPLAGFRNVLINGAMEIAQRGSVSLSNNVGVYGGCDRWIGGLYNFTTASGTLSQAGSVGSRVQEILVTSSTGTNSTQVVSFSQRIEAANAAHLNGKTITISAELYQDTGSSVTPVFNLIKPNALDNYSASTFITGVTLSSLASGARTTYTCTVTLGASDASNGLLVEIVFRTPFAMTNKYFQIAKVQLEPGPVATPFERRPIGTELALCQRYFQIASFLDAGYVGGVNALDRRGFLVPPMRATPTIVVTASSNTNTTGATFLPVSSSVYSFQAVGAAAGGYIYSATANFSAEL